MFSIKLFRAGFHDVPDNFTDYLIAFVVALTISLKFSFLFSSQVITGWDTVGHYYLSSVYSSFFSDFRSTGYDTGWFNGFPAFYFYPPFFYFIVANIHKLFLSSFPFAASFNVTVLLVILFFSLSFLRLSVFLFTGIKNGRIYALIALLFYVLYPGDDLQGTSIAGAMGGTINSTLGHSWIVLTFYFLERYRKENTTFLIPLIVISISLLFYSHLLSSVFFYIFLLLYFIFHAGDFNRRISSAGIIFFLPMLIAFPILYMFLHYSVFTNSNSIWINFPFATDIMGRDFLNKMVSGGNVFNTLLTQLIFHLKILNLLLLFLYFRFILNLVSGRMQNRTFLFLFFTNLAFFWLSSDASLSFLFPKLGIHWYRCFDLFYITFVLISVFSFCHMAESFPEKRVQKAMPIVIFIVLFVKFIVWNPYRDNGYNNIYLYNYNYEGNRGELEELENYMSGLEPGSLIMPEKMRTKSYYGSPHFLDISIQKSGHRNFLGLTVESSLTPELYYAYLSRGLPSIFVWGIEYSWKDFLFDPDRGLYDNKEILPYYLKNSGVNYVIGMSESTKGFLGNFPEYFEKVFENEVFSLFRILNSSSKIAALSEKPIGFLFYDSIKTKKRNEKKIYRSFLLFSNASKYYLKPFYSAPTIINLNSPKEAIPLEKLSEYVSGIVIYNDGYDRPAVHDVQKYYNTGLPLYLFNFRKTSEHPGVNYFNSKEKIPQFKKEIRGKKAVAQKYRSDITPEVFSGEQIVFRPDSFLKAASKSGAVVSGSCVPGEIKISYFPDWRSKNGEPIFQTDANQMYMRACGEKTELNFSGPFPRLITAVLYLLVVGLFSIPLLYRFVSGGTPFRKRNI